MVMILAGTRGAELSPVRSALGTGKSGSVRAGAAVNLISPPGGVNFRALVNRLPTTLSRKSASNQPSSDRSGHWVVKVISPDLASES